MFDRADQIDLNEGVVAYERYNAVMRAIADYYHFDLDRVIAAFVSLSPNSSYNVNLRSLVSVLHGINRGLKVEDIIVATYGHCKQRAFAYAKGQKDFMTETKGPKILAFYNNILDPSDTRWVTVDGHMHCVWSNQTMTMREALVTRKQYREIATDIKRVAFKNYLRPNQMQAILWFTRKRLAQVIYNPQMSLFADSSDVWQSYQQPETIRPFKTNGIDQ